MRKECRKLQGARGLGCACRVKHPTMVLSSRLQEPWEKPISQLCGNALKDLRFALHHRPCPHSHIFILEKSLISPQSLVLQTLSVFCKLIGELVHFARDVFGESWKAPFGLIQTPHQCMSGPIPSSSCGTLARILAEACHKSQNVDLRSSHYLILDSLQALAHALHPCKLPSLIFKHLGSL